MIISFNYYSISLILGAFTALMSGFIVIANDKRRPENQAWFALTMCTAIWSTAYLLMTVTTDKRVALMSNWILHYAAIFIPLFYFLVVLIVTDTFKKFKKCFILFTSIAFIFTLINPLQIFVSDVIPKVGFNYAPVPGPAYIFFFLYFCLLVTVGLIITAKQIKYEQEDKNKKRLIYTILFTLSASLGGGSVFLTTFLTVIPPYFLILFSIYPAISGYAILKHQLFDVKIVAAQIITFSLWIFVLVRAIFSDTPKEQMANGILLLAVIIFGVLLILSITKEVRTREKIEKLAVDLELANDKLKELDQQKSEFVSLASHQLRGPLTAIKGYVSLILEGDFGQISAEVKDALEKVFKSTNDLVVVVGDYLDVSRIDQGRMKYDFTNFNLKDLVETVVNEQKPSIEKAKLGIKFDFSPNENYDINADRGKIKQIIGNFLDNSIKYTPHGEIHVWVSKNNQTKKVLVTISDTGVGIPEEVLPQLFEKFTRAPDASKTNIIGTGLGLYVAKKMVESHHGRVWAESAGAGKGSSFFIELDSIN